MKKITALLATLSLVVALTTSSQNADGAPARPFYMTNNNRAKLPPNNGVTLPPNDADLDGVPNAKDVCPKTSQGVVVGFNGCPKEDADQDGVADTDDGCPMTAMGAPVNTVAGINWVGCKISTDPNGNIDGDGLLNNEDWCDYASGPNTGYQGEKGCPDADGDGFFEADEPQQPNGGLNPNAIDFCPLQFGTQRGCPDKVTDTDGDGTPDYLDWCPGGGPSPIMQNLYSGCAGKDSDGDGVSDDYDVCSNTPTGVAVNTRGCPDSDGDGVFDNHDYCSNTPTGAAINVHGCPDSDGDGFSDDIDNCPNQAGPNDPYGGCQHFQGHLPFPVFNP